MNEKEFEDLLYIITANTVNLIIKQTGWSENYALERFVISKVYSKLEIEETKVWHLSTTMLAELFNDERSGNLVWPEVVWQLKF